MCVPCIPSWPLTDGTVYIACGAYAASVHFGSRGRDSRRQERVDPKKTENGIIVGWARRQTSRYEDATNERARSLSLSVSQSVSQSCSDRFDVDGKSAALVSGREISERRRQAACRGTAGGGDGEEDGRVISRIWLMTVKCSGKLVQRGRHS